MHGGGLGLPPQQRPISVIKKMSILIEFSILYTR